MTDNPDDVVRVASGSLVQIELYQAGLKDEGITSKVVGLDLTGGVGTLIPNSVELWVHRGQAAAAAAAIRDMEAERGTAEFTDPPAAE